MPPRLLPDPRRKNGLDKLRREDAVLVDEGLEDDAAGGIGRRDHELARCVTEVVRGAEDERDRAVELGVFDDLRLLRGDREHDDLLLAVERRRLTLCRRTAGGGLLLLLLRGRRRREKRAEDLDALEQELDARGVQARNRLDGLVAAAERDDREVVAGDADE